MREKGEVEQRAKAATRRLGQMVKDIETMRAHALDQSAAMARWLLASLVAMNGGAAASLLSLDQPRASLRTALLWFVIGIVAALTTGIAAYYEAEFGGIAAERMKDNLQDRLVGLEGDEGYGKFLRRTRYSRWATLLFFPVSLLGFILGAWHARHLVS